MTKLTRTGRFLSVAALATSTALSGPLAAYAQDADSPVRLAQAPEQPAPEAPTSEEVPAPAPEAPPEPQAAPEPAPEPEAAPEPAAEPEAAPEPEPAAEPEPSPEPALDVPAEPEPEPEPAPEPAPEPVQPPEAESAVPAPEDTAPVEDAPVGQPEELPTDEGTASDAPAPEAPAAEEPALTPPAGEAPTAPDPAPQTPAEAAPSTPAEEPPVGEDSTGAPVEGEAPAAPAPEVAPDAVTPAPDGTSEESPAAPDVTPPQPPIDEGTSQPVDPTTGAEAPAPEGEAAPAQSFAAPPEPLEAPQPVDEAIQLEAVQPGGVAASDARVQNIDQSVTINSVTNIEGNRIEAAPAAVLPPDVQVIERVGNRDILTYAGAALAGAAAGAAATYFIKSNDNERLRENSQEFYVEELPRRQTRETIVRDNGVQVVTIYNEYGDVVQRSRILPDGREVVLFYDPYLEDAADPNYYYDVGADLPPLNLTIPRDRYIVDVAQPDERLYYDTIVAPPVETVERIYSIDEVRRSERIRDKVRRIDLNTVNFAFGSADIDQGQVENLQALADAIAQVIEENPDETFLLEGHTDAVGSNAANLALSDRRAEAVAIALTDYFDIPPENLVTQGYGEEYLKVDTQEPNAENRRVTLRRITALVKPVVSAQAN
ncbi:OmpA family protein [Aureimonas mangrovi]|uniref:OmpA family protein n=1 Tax=Aureimonas mangrovi TaxID=2758041 RepID=UPI00163DBFCA|nr:OmpA family protein [Aureimonas mangrovi]